MEYAAIIERLEGIESDLAERQEEYEQAAGDDHRHEPAQGADARGRRPAQRPDVRHEARCMTTATWDIAYAEPEQKTTLRILHLAEREQGYTRALCGREREGQPLEANAVPGVDGDPCVVCFALHFRKHGFNYSEAPE
jgi:hypothetical protein